MRVRAVGGSDGAIRTAQSGPRRVRHGDGLLGLQRRPLAKRRALREGVESRVVRTRDG